MSRVFVTSVSRYSMDNDKGQHVEGTSVQLLAAEKLDPVIDEFGTKGVKSGKVSLGYDHFDDFPFVPGFYEAEPIVKTNSKGAMSVTYGGFKFICDAFGDDHKELDVPVKDVDRKGGK